VNPNKILYFSDKFHKLAQGDGAGILFICTDNKTALLLQRSTEVSEPGTWGLPGGQIKPGEKPYKAAIREAKEELGALPEIGKLIDNITNKNKQSKYHVFVIDIPKEDKKEWERKISLNYENIKYAWFSLGELPENLHSPIKPILE